ncbi:AAA domain-containing protein [Clostridium collagenovorans DSM 3089]|uniref:AAA domain-containing protein n=1 Tax=Clostridium collagenovorans DSM 3089 TaxID=1121306 RepID=A0A1M5SDC3_9CLOT|nr:kinase [Clostridium collagenovorans]SHH35923.1 AAA domain-containing protein [Clostridium collagenovorans DSM 3089]
MGKDAKLIILRGNSGSGKTTTGKALQKKLGHGTMLISQDVIRREILFVKDGPETEARKLLLELALYGKENCDIVILEGILNYEWYKDLFEKLSYEFENQVFAYYFDIPFEETLNRHKQKPNAHEFGEKEMRKWWKEKDLLGIIPEKLLWKELSLDEIVDLIYEEVIRERT